MESDLEDWFSGHVIEAQYEITREGVRVHWIRLESNSGESLGWMTHSLTFASLDKLNEYLESKPAFLASDLGDTFLFVLSEGGQDG